MLVILGPTATGKTTLSAHLAYRLNGEVISADSRQVYRQMNIGAGKDLNEYTVNGISIPYHLIDIVDIGSEYNAFRFMQDFFKVYNEIVGRNKLPILCGGSGMYIEAVLKGYRLIEVPVNEQLRNELAHKSDDDLIRLLSSLKKLHNTTDTKEKSRLIRAIEIEIYKKEHPEISPPSLNLIEKAKIFGIFFDRKIIRERITKRLQLRLQQGLIEEVKEIIKNGILPEKLKSYGLEYKFVTQYIIGEISYDEMFRKLNTAIHQFAKRQMTWFRRMERQGFKIYWIDGNLPLEEKIHLTQITQ